MQRARSIRGVAMLPRSIRRRRWNRVARVERFVGPIVMDISRGLSGLTSADHLRRRQRTGVRRRRRLRGHLRDVLRDTLRSRRGSLLALGPHRRHGTRGPRCRGGSGARNLDDGRLATLRRRALLRRGRCCCSRRRALLRCGRCCCSRRRARLGGGHSRWRCCCWSDERWGHLGRRGGDGDDGRSDDATPSATSRGTLFVIGVVLGERGEDAVLRRWSGDRGWQRWVNRCGGRSRLRRRRRRGQGRRRRSLWRRRRGCCRRLDRRGSRGLAARRRRRAHALSLDLHLSFRRSRCRRFFERGRHGRAATVGTSSRSNAIERRRCRDARPASNENTDRNTDSLASLSAARH